MKYWLIFILIFFVVRYLLPIVLRMVLGSFMRKQMRNGGFVVPPQAQPGAGRATRPGEVHVDYVPPTAPDHGKPAGFQAASMLILKR